MFFTLPFQWSSTFLMVWKMNSSVIGISVEEGCFITSNRCMQLLQSIPMFGLCNNHQGSEYIFYHSSVNSVFSLYLSQFSATCAGSQTYRVIKRNHLVFIQFKHTVYPALQTYCVYTYVFHLTVAAAEAGIIMSFHSLGNDLLCCTGTPFTPQ